MEAAGVISSFTTIQSALNVISLLQLTAYRYPQQASVQDGDYYDYIIVGAGSAGCVVANRLTEDPNVTVLLIEAGGDPPAQANIPSTFTYNLKSNIDWNYTTADCSYSCHKDRVDTLFRGKVLGGSSSINFHFYVRGDPEDFNTWAQLINDETWNYNNVLSYFIKSERLENTNILDSSTGVFHGKNGLLGVTVANMTESISHLEAFAELGFDIVLDTNGNNTLGYVLPQVTIADGYRQSTANTFLSNAKDRPNLKVLKNTLATKIEFEGNVAVGVNIISEGQEITFKAKKEIILSAGAINSPQLLMLSGIGPKSHLESFGINVIADLPVGENLQDHIFVSVLHTLGEASSKPTNPHLYPFPLIAGYVTLNSSQTFPDYQTTTLVMNSDAVAQLCY